MARDGEGREGDDLKEGDLEMGNLKTEEGSLNEEEESLLVSRDDISRDVEEGRKEYHLKGPELPNIIITPTRRHLRQSSCTFATPDPDIQLAEPRRASSCVSVVPVAQGIVALCGPKPGKISLICLFVLTIWASWIFLIHLNKELSNMAVELTESKKELKILEESSLAFRVESAVKISKLQSQLHKIIVKRKRVGSTGQSVDSTDQSVDSTDQSVDSTDQSRPNQIINQDDEHLEPSSSSTKLPHFEDEKLCAANGSPCIFPFLYNGKNETSCVKLWYDLKPWCPTRVGPDGEFISDNSAWDYCQSCP